MNNLNDFVFKQPIFLLLVILLPVGPGYALTLTVTSNGNADDNNVGDGICLTASNDCSLRAAIEEANAASEAVTINFAHQFTSSDFGAITTCSYGDYPILDSNVTLDGSAQWKSVFDEPGIQIIPNACDYGHLLTITGDNNAIFGIAFTSSDGSLSINRGGGNHIGGSGPGQRNVFIGVGIAVDSEAENYIAYNYFGTWDGNVGVNVLFDRPAIRVGVLGGGNAVIANNIIGRYRPGILLYGTASHIESNIIGDSRYSNSTIPNAVGIEIHSSNNLIESNRITGNTEDGILLVTGSNNEIRENKICCARYDGGNLGNGINLTGDGNIIKDNQISGNRKNGIYAHSATNINILGNEISGNVINGIHLFDSSGLIGVDPSGIGNTVISNQQHGIYLENCHDLNIKGNDIGLKGRPDYKGNFLHGIFVDSGSQGNVIGGESPQEANWIGWNYGDGIRLSGINTSNNIIVGNIIGAAKDWSSGDPNGQHGIGLYDGASHNVIGGLTAGNTIVANKWSGVAIVNSNNNSVVGNRIGTDGGSIKWGNSYYGLDIVNSSGSSVAFNEIAYNGGNNNQPGVKIDGSVSTIGNHLSANSIHDNRGVGIALANGGNAGIASPVINRNGEEIHGTACQLCTIELFSGYDEEGRYYEGSVKTNNVGQFTWSGNIRGNFVTATATDTGNNTSAFSGKIPFPSSDEVLFYLPAIMSHRAH